MKRKLNRTIQSKMHGISPVWIVPFVALLIAIWLAVQARMEKGTEIEITFSKAFDIMAGQTKIKLKDVEVGSITKVRLSDDLSSVIVTADLDRSVTNFLSANSRFWVVTPKISATGVSNLGTLINGVFIQMDPGVKGNWQTRFRGLDNPPLFQSGEPGMRFVLQADELGSLDVGSPIYYRKVRVGEVTSYLLAEEATHVDINFFIRAPFDALVEEDSRFWNVSGVDVSVGSDGVKAKMASLASLMGGGVAFENIHGFNRSREANPGHRFFLYPDKDSVIQGQFDQRYFYRTQFSRTVKGLSIGAPVEFRGIKVGEVVNIELTSSDNVEDALHVYLAIEPERMIKGFKPTRAEADSHIEGMIRQGLRAQLKSGSLITGSKLIDLAYVSKSSVSKNHSGKNNVSKSSVSKSSVSKNNVGENAGDDFAMVRKEKFSVIPSAPDALDDITDQVAEIVTKVNAIPVDEIGRDLAQSMASLNRILVEIEQRDTAGRLEEVLVSTDEALKQLTHTMSDVNTLVAPDSALKHELTETLEAVGNAANSLDRFVEELNRQPNALIFGAEKDD